MLTRIMTFMTNSYRRVPVRGRINYRLKSITVILSSALLVFLFLSGCEEDPSRIGGSILPGADFQNVGATDTFSVRLTTEYIDTIRSEQPLTSFMGGFDDQVFGTTTTGFVTQLWLYESWPNNGLKRIDSVTFYLNVVDLIGTMTGEGTLNVYETDELMDLDEIYYVNRDVPIKDLLFSVPVTGITGDSLVAFTLPPSVGEALTRDTTMLFLSNDSADFRTLIKGLYFEYIPQVNDHMLKVDLLNGATSMVVHYMDADSASTFYSFAVNSKCIRYNRYLHDFLTADPDKKIGHISDGVIDSLSYIQSFQGVFTRVEIPGLEIFKTMNNVGINKAELVFPAFVNDDYFPEERILSISLLARYINSDGLREMLPDYLVSASFFDGAYYSLDREYRINIVNFIQDYIDGVTAEPVLELFLPQDNADNLILRSDSPDKPVKIEVVYSMVN